MVDLCVTCPLLAKCKMDIFWPKAEIGSDRPKSEIKLEVSSWQSVPVGDWPKREIGSDRPKKELAKCRRSKVTGQKLRLEVAGQRTGREVFS